MRTSRSLVLLPAVALATSLALPIARADVGPRAPCGAGEHHEYLYGHHCVPDGSHLERDKDGHPTIVKDGAAPTPVTPPVTPAPTTPPSPTFATPPVATTPATPAPETPATPSAPPPPEPPPQRGCACALGEAPESPAVALLGLAAALFSIARIRRRPARPSSE
ncbi:MAG: MYXO-CTERM sorting domain-containing protein [Byssovorax sp.]